MEIISDEDQRLNCYPDRYRTSRIYPAEMRISGLRCPVGRRTGLSDIRSNTDLISDWIPDIKKVLIFGSYLKINCKVFIKTPSDAPQFPNILSTSRGFSL